jgi:glycosyltransferase involved in cell wall biosynthesis
MVKALNARRDVSAEIATTDANGPNQRLSRHELPAGSPIHAFSRTWSEQWKLSTGLRQWLDDRAKEYGLVHIHGLWSYSTWIAARAARRAGVPYLVRPAGMLSPYTWSRGRLKKRVYWALVERRTVRHASGFHVTSEEEAEEVRRVRPNARIFVIPNGVEAVAFSAPSDNSKLKARFGPLANGAPILLFLSRLHPKKGIVDRLLPAVAAMRSRALLAIVGSEDAGARGYEQAITSAIRQLSLEDRVSLLGPVVGDERWSLYDGAAALVLPSHAENFGIVVAEAMARACPVVVTKEVQSASLVRQAAAGAVVDGGPAEIATALDAFVSDEQKRVSAGDHGREFARRHLQWLSVAERLTSMYHEILAGA